jgi:hypothetical protein
VCCSNNVRNNPDKGKITLPPMLVLSHQPCF